MQKKRQTQLFDFNARSKTGDTVAARFADKTLLQKINKEATARRYNRTLDESRLDTLNDEIIVAIDPIIIHEHAQGKPVDPHLRCSVVFVYPKSAPWSGLMLDVPFELFELLPTEQELIKTPA